MKDPNHSNTHYRLIFILIFLVVSIGDSFNVLYAQKLALKQFGLGHLEFYVGLSFTLMLVMMVIGIAFSGILVKQTESMPAYLRDSVILVALGMLLLASVEDYWFLVLAFMLFGLGSGFAYVGIRYAASLSTGERERILALSFIGGGGFVGQCMGTIIGGVLAGQIPYRVVYLVAAVMCLVPLIVLQKEEDYRRVKLGKASEFIEVLKNRNAVLFLAFVVFPIYTSGAFLSCQLPLDIQYFGFSETVTAAFILMEYILAAYLGPYMTGVAHKKHKPLIACFMLAVLYGVPMLCYSFFQNIWVLLLSLICFGIGDSFGLNMVQESFNHTKGDAGYHNNNALVVFLLVSRLGATLSPTLLMLVGTPFLLSVLILTCVILYCVVRRFKLPGEPSAKKSGN